MIKIRIKRGRQSVLCLYFFFSSMHSHIVCFYKVEINEKIEHIYFIVIYDLKEEKGIFNNFNLKF